MKIPLKAFIIIYPENPYPQSENIKIGGVASSASKELANENGGIVVPLTGFYNLKDLSKLVKDRIESNQDLIKHYLSKNELKDIPLLKDMIKMDKKLLLSLKTKKLESFTNLSHFSKKELKVNDRKKKSSKKKKEAEHIVKESLSRLIKPK